MLPASQDRYISPSEPHIGSNEEVEQDIFMLYSNSIDDDEVDIPAYERLGQESKNINHIGRAMH